jgi:hypothetical protein
MVCGVVLLTNFDAHRADCLLTFARLAVLDWLYPPQETPVDWAIREEDKSNCPRRPCGLTSGGDEIRDAVPSAGAPRRSGPATSDLGARRRARLWGTCMASRRNLDEGAPCSVEPRSDAFRYSLTK